MQLVVGILLLNILQLRSQFVDDECPSIYTMIDEHHSFCAKKLSIESLPPTFDQIKLILDMHNEERMDVNAINMQKMHWNDDLADIAQHYADHCDYNHDTSSQRQAPRIPLSTGQNLAMGYRNWTLAIRGWADEKADFVYGRKPKHGVVVGHYTQMVKDTAALIGCGLAICPKDKVDPNHDWPYYVCNYVTGQLGDNKPYTPADSNNKSLHDCYGIVCLYNGILNLTSCKCKCESYAYGKQCENLNCSTLTNHCDYGQDKKFCQIYSNVPYECPKFCGLCDRYEHMRDYFNSLEFSKDIQIVTIENSRSIFSSRCQSISVNFIQIINVLIVLFLIK